MERVVKGMTTLPWVAVGLVLLFGPLQLGAALEGIPLKAEPTGRLPEGIPPKIEVRETPTEVRIELPGDVLSDFDKADIRPEAEPTLRQVAEIIQRT